MIRTSLTLLALILTIKAYSQGVGIGTSIVDPSAVLEIHSQGDNSGLLIPRVTSRNTVIVSHNPIGLTVYDLNDNGYYYYDGNSWLRLASEDMSDHHIRNLADGTASKDAVNKGQMDSADDQRLAKTGGTMTGAINMNTNKVTNVGAGTNDADAVNLSQLNSEIASLQNQINTLTSNINDLTNKLGFLRVGSQNIGDIQADTPFTITFPSVKTSDYVVLSSVEGRSTDVNDDNDISYVIYDKRPTSFKMYFREYHNNVQSLRVRYMLVRSDTRTN